jgi:ArsR family transcriptional regulator
MSRKQSTFGVLRARQISARGRKGWVDRDLNNSLLARIGIRRYVRSVMNDLVLAAKALADPTRVRVLAVLRDGELCVCEMSDALEVTQSTLSTHLQLIREADLVQTRKEGKWIYYALKPEARRLIKGVFDFFADGLETDRLLRRDASRLQKRLAEREDGACCRGFSPTPT